ncbi:MAG: Tm-1-like ATP-binding domain-containing protein, partial [Actinomycetota bacterium]
MAEDGPHPRLPVVAVLATLDSKAREIEMACDVLAGAGARPWVVDLSLRPHHRGGADVTGEAVAEAGGSDWAALAALGRGEAGEVMMAGGRKLVAAEAEAGRVHAALGLGGANGTSIACGIMREMPLLFPKLMVSVVASTPAVQWYVGASDIVMFPSVGDLSLNRVTAGVIENAAVAAVAMARHRMARPPE